VQKLGRVLVYYFRSNCTNRYRKATFQIWWRSVHT